MKSQEIKALVVAVSVPLTAAHAVADAVIYGKANVSVDYVDAKADAAWNRPAIGSPSFDMDQFIDDANDVLAAIGYVGVPGPGGVNTAIADVIFGTVLGTFTFGSLNPGTQRGILRSLQDATTVGQPFNGWDLNANDRGNRIGIKGSEDLGGMKAIYQVEMQVPLADANGDIDDGDSPASGSSGTGGFFMRNSFVGLTGGWGTALMGRHDTVLKMSTGYAFGNNMIKAMYGRSDLDPCADPWNVGFRYSCSTGVLGQVFGTEFAVPIDQKDKSTWSIGFDHNFSKRTKVYALYVALDDEVKDADWHGFSLGMSHQF